MKESRPASETPAEPDPLDGAPAASTTANAAQPAAAPATRGSGAANQLTPEEQMARFEQELKYDDWGHQPC